MVRQYDEGIHSKWMPLVRVPRCLAERCDLLRQKIAPTIEKIRRKKPNIRQAQTRDDRLAWLQANRAPTAQRDGAMRFAYCAGTRAFSRQGNKSTRPR
jgi:hypothetical protein